MDGTPQKPRSETPGGVTSAGQYEIAIVDNEAGLGHWLDAPSAAQYRLMVHSPVDGVRNIEEHALSQISTGEPAMVPTSPRV